MKQSAKDKVEFRHQENVTICTIFSVSTGMTFYGEAKCAPEDEDKYSEKIGEYIAEERAWIALLRHCRVSLEDTIRAQAHLINCMEQIKDFNHKDREYRILKRDYYYNREALKELRTYIANAQSALRYYIGRH